MKRLISLFSVAVLVALAAPAAADFTATGTFQYEDLPIDINGFQSPHPTRPCRYVDVRVIDNTTQAVLASGATDASGYFSIAVTDAVVRNVAILALTQSVKVLNLNYAVIDWNTSAVHAYQGILVGGHDPNTDIDMGAVTAHYRAGGEPLNLYDASFDANDCIGSMQGGVRPTAYNIRYTLDVSNDTAYYNGVVNIGGNFGYDDTILLHETGHAMTAKYGGWSDSPGGSHYVEDNAQDPRLSWGEAWPTFFCSNVRDWAGYNHPHVYLNSTGDSTTGHISFSYSLEAPQSPWGVGAASEVAVQASLWDMTDGDATPDNTPGVDDEPGYQMDRTFPELWSFIILNLSQPTPFNGVETYEDFHDLWIANAVDPQTVELASVEYLNHGIQYRDDAYENDDTFAAPGTYLTFEDIGLGRKTHHTTWPEGDEDWVKFQGLAGVTYLVNTATMRDGADTYVEILNASQTVLASNDNAGVPVFGDYNTYELLRSTRNYVPPATQDLWLRVRRSPNAPYGPYSKYGNWDLTISVTAVPATYPNITTAPPTSVTKTLEQDAQLNVNLTINNTGTVDSLVYNLVEAGGPISWVSENPLTNTVPPGQARISVLTFDATGLNLGYYTDSIEVHSNDPNLPVKYLRLNLTVIEAVDAVEGSNPSPVTWLGESSPNPATPETAIRFSLCRAGHARLAIYDVQGREVVRLLDGARPAGEQATAWNGRDQDQQPVPSGVYFYRLEAEGRSLSRRLVMTR
jgi:hypothetical protein